MPAVTEELDPKTTGTASPVSESPAAVATETPEPTELESWDDADGPNPALDDLNSPEYAQAMGDAPTPGDATPPVPDGLKQDEKGRWRNADGTFAEKQPTKEAEASVKAEVAAAQTAKAAAEAPKNTDWKPNIYGKEDALFPGALRSPTGDLFVPAEHVGRMNMLIARGTKWDELNQRERQTAQRTAQYGEREKFMGESFSGMIQKTLLNPEWMAWATKSEENYQTAKMQASLMLEQAETQLTAKFGALPKPTDAAPAAEPLDQYDGLSSVDSLLDELLKAPENNGVLSAPDKQAVLAILRQHDVPLFHQHPEHGWLLDERPVRLAVEQRRELVKAGRQKQVTQPKVEQATRRNDAAVPKPTETPAKAAPKAEPKKDADPYADRPWDNPKLDFHEKRRLWQKAKGFATPGS